MTRRRIPLSRCSFIAALAVAASGATALAQQQTFHIDPAASQVHFTLSDVLHTVHGTFSVRPGTLHFDRKSGAMGGEIVVAAGSGDSGSRMRDDRMSKDELHSESYPTVTFAPQHFSGTLALPGDSTVNVDGIFTLLGKPHPLQVPMHLHLENGRCTATGTFQVPYVDWGLKNPSTLMLRVAREVEIDLDLKGSLTTP